MIRRSLFLRAGRVTARAEPARVVMTYQAALMRVMAARPTAVRISAYM